MTTTQQEDLYNPVVFSSVNKSTFKCFQMADGSVYYGEVDYVLKDPHVPVINHEDLEEVKAKSREVRHGNGI